jgi:hypothetical protein
MTRIITMNETYDFEIKDNKGFRKKAMPQFGTS